MSKDEKLRYEWARECCRMLDGTREEALAAFWRLDVRLKGKSKNLPAVRAHIEAGTRPYLPVLLGLCEELMATRRHSGS